MPLAISLQCLESLLTILAAGFTEYRSVGLFESRKRHYHQLASQLDFEYQRTRMSVIDMRCRAKIQTRPQSYDNSGGCRGNSRRVTGLLTRTNQVRYPATGCSRRIPEFVWLSGRCPLYPASIVRGLFNRPNERASAAAKRQRRPTSSSRESLMLVRAPPQEPESSFHPLRRWRGFPARFLGPDCCLHRP